MLLEHGARLPAGERAGFLQVFHAPRTNHHDPDLLNDVESFVADITKGAYAEGYGFDSGYGEYRTFGDESWTVEMDVDGLADLARAPGPHRAEAYRDWVDGLVRAGRVADAELAAHEALQQLDAHGSTQAELADRLTVLAIATLQRLLRLVAAATTLDRRDEVLTLEAGRVVEGPLAQRSDLAASLLLLAGRVDEASSLLATTNRARWEHRTHPGPVVVPFMLVGGSGATGDERSDPPCCDTGPRRGRTSVASGSPRMAGAD
ncbi:MAG: hypothetical protein ACRDSG_12080 [Pseudonocardiaceae bacterium]